MEKGLKDKSFQFPKSPGVYLMLDDQGKYLYIGKAKNLCQRLGSYFSEEGDGRYQIKYLMPKVHQIETIVTRNEKEALLLENTLIKKHKPPYNIFLKDDKSYLSLKLTALHPFPRLVATRKIEKDGSLYFGPYASALKAREVLDFIEQHFRLRNCSEHDFSNRVRACLQYQIKRCDAPCVGLISQKAYAEIVRQVKWFLSGKTEKLLQDLRQKMEKASEALAFEEAAHLRDLVDAIQATLEKQKVVSHFAGDQDVVGLYREVEKVSIAVLVYRGGTLVETKSFLWCTPQQSSELLTSFLVQYYQEPSRIPREILLPFPLESLDSLEDILSDRRTLPPPPHPLPRGEGVGGRVRFVIPARGDKRLQVKLAEKNACEKLQQATLLQDEREKILTSLQKKLHLSKFPRRIECYDISNLQGKMAVGSRVCFVEGRPDKTGYRCFKIKTVDQANDFAMLYEVLVRRLSHEDWPLPDLIVMDGGKGQLHAARRALQDRNVLWIDLIALAKEKIPPRPPLPKGGRGDLKKPERVFLEKRKNPILLGSHSPELHLLMHLRDEAHRFGIMYHRKLRGKKVLHSILDEISGIGSHRKKELLKYFGSIKRLSEASIEEITAVKGITSTVAENVYHRFHS